MEWSTYALSDFLMFSPPVYWRLVASYNAALWPLQALALAGGGALLAFTLRRADRPLGPCLLLAAAWAHTGWGFHWSRYADIFLAAPWLAAACWLQAVLLLAGALLPARGDSPGSPAHWPGVALVAIGALLYPLAAARDWQGAEVFGLMPDPTALATLGWLLATNALRPWIRAGLAVLPVLSLLLGGATRAGLAQ